MIFRRSITLMLPAVFLCTSAVLAQTPGLQQQIMSRYVLTKPTADRTDLVTTGDVIVLEKDNLYMCSITSALPSNNTYKDGKIQQSLFNKAKFFTAPGNAPTVPTRVFVTGEKFWITGVDQKEDGIVLSLLSDEINGTRYYASLKFPFPKGTVPQPEQVLNAIADVIKVQPSDNGGGARPAPAPPAPAMAPIAPPPPPADTAPATPPTIALGQTKDQVKAMFGAPTKIVKLSTKEIDYYPDMKVTFVHDKVTNVE